MCRQQKVERGDWVAAERLHHGRRVVLPESMDERFWIARQLMDEHGEAASMAANKVGLAFRDFIRCSLKWEDVA